MKRVLVASVFALSGVYGLSAQAQPPYPAQQPYPAQPSYQAQPPYQAPPTGEVSQPYFEKIVPAPSQAFEINGTVAYTQPWGNLTDNLTAQSLVIGRRIQDFAGAGIQFGLDLGYRASPMLSLGIYGTYAGYHNSTPLDGADFRSVTAGIQGGWHFRPFRSVDPWVTLGSAWRGNWFVPEVGGITSIQGWQLARLQVGADFRLAPAVAVGPYVSGDVNLMFSERVPNTDFRSMNGTPTYASFTAGVIGRFDVGGTYVRPSGALAHR